MDGEGISGLEFALWSAKLSIYVARLPARAHGLGLLCLLDCMTHLHQITGQAMVGVEESWGSIIQLKGARLFSAQCCSTRLVAVPVQSGTTTNTKRRKHLRLTSTGK
jgi:hypothetical protein